MASKLLFGVDQLEEIGVVQSMTCNSSVEVAEARGEDGKVIERRAYSRGDEYSVEALVVAGKTVPPAGSTVTIDTKTYLVTASSVTRSNTDFQKVSLTVSRKDAEEVVTYAADNAG